jgi:hypothetical protein
MFVKKEVPCGFRKERLSQKRTVGYLLFLPEQPANAANNILSLLD